VAAAVCPKAFTAANEAQMAKINAGTRSMRILLRGLLCDDYSSLAIVESALICGSIIGFLGMLGGSVFYFI